MQDDPIQLGKSLNLITKPAPGDPPSKVDRASLLRELRVAKGNVFAMTRLRALLPAPASALTDEDVLSLVATSITQGRFRLVRTPNNPKCSTPIMQPQYIATFAQMGNQLQVNPLFIMSTALQESGWNLAHVYGTNSSSHGQPLNNLFGMTSGGGNNIAYPSVAASAQAWIADWGSYLSDHPQTIQAYAAALNSNPRHMYNSNPAYPGELAARYKQLVAAAAACGTKF